jgi:hypothetical protein
MKLQGALLLIVLLAAGQAGAQSQTNATSASATITVQKPKLHWLAPATMTNSTENLKPVKGLDPRAWTTVAGWYPGESAFATGETHRSKLVLFWVDIEPVPSIR